MIAAAVRGYDGRSALNAHGAAYSRQSLPASGHARRLSPEFEVCELLVQGGCCGGVVDSAAHVDVLGYGDLGLT